MNGQFDPILTQLCGSDERAFERGLQGLTRRWSNVVEAARLGDLLTALEALGDSRALGPTEMSRRVRIVVDTAKLPERQSRELATSLSNLPPAVRQTVTTALPPSLRRLVYMSQPQKPPPETEIVPTPTSMDPDPDPPSEAPAAEAVPEERECASVILLGTAADHEENRLTLERNEFVALRATTIAQLDEYLDGDVCGIVVARSWWPGITDTEREGVLNKILGHSSFAWLKFDTQHLPCNAVRFEQLLHGARHAVPAMGECVCQDGWRITEHDMVALKRIRDVLANSEAVRLCPADIQEAQARVLIGAAIKHVRQRNFAGPFRLTRVEANPIPGGRSFARIIRMAPDDDGTPLVAKVDAVDRLSDEMRRFQRYAQKWDAALSPQLHYHAGTSLIIFGLVESPESPGRPAPTLEETLETMFYCEHWPESYIGPDENELRELVNRAIRKLQRLNAVQNDNHCKNKTYVFCEPYQSVSRLGMHWNIEPCDGGGGSVFDHVSTARYRVDRLVSKAIVHGDVQLRNILVRDGREPHFIDYANCGPGHPCFDLVRLECAVLFYCGRMNGGERELAAVLLDMLRGRTEAEIRVAHPLFYTSRTNRLAIHTCIACRTASLETLATFGGTEDDYLAMKFVLTCQSLFLIHLQAGIVRSQLAALGTMLRNRAGWSTQSVGKSGEPPHSGEDAALSTARDSPS